MKSAFVGGLVIHDGLSRPERLQGAGRGLEPEHARRGGWVVDSGQKVGTSVDLCQVPVDTHGRGHLGQVAHRVERVRIDRAQTPAQWVCRDHEFGVEAGVDRRDGARLNGGEEHLMAVTSAILTIKAADVIAVRRGLRAELRRPS